MRGIKNIIFDLGGVIINLDIKKTIAEFNNLCDFNFETFYTQNAQNSLFDDFDKGTICEKDFFKSLAKDLRFKGELDYLVNAWNAMLLDIPEHRLNTLIEAKQKYSTFLLSNTNETHIKIFENHLYQMHGVKHFSDYFDGLYYSCRVGMRKPNADFFNFVLQKHKLNPHETVFIDDTEIHVKAAGQLGINSFLLEKSMDVKTLLKELKLL
ncbi:MAG: HAD family phosphatase [Bacteroidetes bacterium]|nr:HAD family phosphatase [Bacteroidota bacterium]